MFDSDYNSLLLFFLFIVVATNVPFGYLRRGYKRFSRPWARTLYIPILINIVLRRFFGLAFKVLPFVVGAVIVGQLIGGAFRSLRNADTG